MSQQFPPDNGQPWNPQQPYGPPSQPGYPPQQPMYSQPPPTFYPPQYPGYPLQPSPQPGQPPPKKQRKSLKQQWNSGKSGKCGVIFACGVLLLVVVLCSSAMYTATNGSQSAATPTQDTARSTPAPATKPAPMAKPKPTAKPVPTQSPAQVEATYKASTTDTTVAALDKDGNNGAGAEEHFTATLVAFVKDSSGNTAGANVSDAASGSFVQVLFTPGTDITQMNAQDVIEVWGTNQGVSSGTNAFGGTVQEVVVQATYMSDQTTGYKVDN